MALSVRATRILARVAKVLEEEGLRCQPLPGGGINAEDDAIGVLLTICDYYRRTPPEKEVR